MNTERHKSRCRIYLWQCYMEALILKPSRKLLSKAELLFLSDESFLAEVDSLRLDRKMPEYAAQVFCVVKYKFATKKKDQEKWKKHAIYHYSVAIGNSVIGSNEIDQKAHKAMQILNQIEKERQKNG